MPIPFMIVSEGKIELAGLQSEFNLRRDFAAVVMSRED